MVADRTSDELTALARQVRSARQTLGISIDDAAASAGMSPVTWGRVEKAQPVRALTYAGIERVLRWKPGSAVAAMAGNEPTPLNGPVTYVTGNADRVIWAINEVLDHDMSDYHKVRTIRGIIADDYRPPKPAPSAEEERPDGP